MRRSVFTLTMVLLLCVLLGSAYNSISVSRLEKKFPPPGKICQVNGKPMHLYCTGSGAPTVLLEAGLGGDWLSWQKVQPELAKTTHVCSYDRAGLGWSRPQAGPQDAVHIAAQLHALLHEAGETGPLVMVGASAGGFYVRQFVSDYPAEVAAVVLVDSSVPDQIKVFPGREDTPTKRKARHLTATLDWLKESSGWARLMGQCRGDVPAGLNGYADVARAESCRPSFTRTWLDEYDEFWHSAGEAAQARCCGDIPLLVISQDPDRPKPGWTAQAIEQQPVWSQLQEGLKRLSSRSRRIVARNSGHRVTTDRPDVVIRNVSELVQELRDKSSHPVYGTTVVQ